jgi:hypothetical protein
LGIVFDLFNDNRTDGLFDMIYDISIDICFDMVFNTALNTLISNFPDIYSTCFLTNISLWCSSFYFPSFQTWFLTHTNTTKKGCWFQYILRYYFDIMVLKETQLKLYFLTVYCKNKCRKKCHKRMPFDVSKSPLFIRHFYLHIVWHIVQHTFWYII